jgi:hypothetical protein
VSRVVSSLNKCRDNPSPEVPCCCLKACFPKVDLLNVFLTQDTSEDRKIQAVMTHSRNFGPNVVISGNWWMSWFFPPRDGELQETIFTWNPWAVQSGINDFDDLFLSLCRNRGSAAEESKWLHLKTSRRSCQDWQRKSLSEDGLYWCAYECPF